jgi:NtrC-family two-component system response regulator AlgB
MVRENSFRLDLLYRLNVISLVLPPLRDRREDLAGLANGFVRRYADSYHLPARRLSDAGLARMQAYAWPGNVRELQNVIERAVILCTREEIGPEHLALGGEPAAAGSASGVAVGAPVSIETLERAHIEAVMARADTLEAAARTLGIDGSTLYRKRKAYGL